MKYATDFGLVEFTPARVRVDGVVLDKLSLVDFMRNLDFKCFYWSLMYADDTHSYRELRVILLKYLTNTLY